MISSRLVSFPCIVALLCVGFGCHSTPKDPDAALKDAIRSSNVEGVKQALSSGAVLTVKDSAGWTPLHRAAAKGDVEVIKVLIASGAKLEDRNETGMTPLHEALSRSKEDAARCLIDAGADVNAKSNSGTSVLAYARAFVSEELQTLIQQKGGL